MCLIIYALKIVIISNKDNKSNIKKFVSRSQFQKLEKFVKFCVLLDVPWWVSCSIAAAPENDLRFVQQLDEYKSQNKSIANFDLQAFSRHLDYLSEEMIPLNLFSDELPDETKHKIALELQSQFENVSLIFIFVQIVIF